MYLDVKVCLEFYLFNYLGQCDKRDVPGHPTKYERHLHFDAKPDMFGNMVEQWVEQECPAGTIFKREVCDCSRVYLETPHYEYEGHGKSILSIT